MKIRWDFLHIPKTGGFTVAAVFGHSGGNHVRASECQKYNNFIFTFVRNPYDRLWSAFRFMQDPQWKQCEVSADMTFREFVVSKHWERKPSAFTRPMTYFIDAPVGYIGRYENFEEDLRRVMKICGVGDGMEIPWQHRNPPVHWTTVYDEEMREIVFDAYKDDFVRFGYGPAIN